MSVSTIETVRAEYTALAIVPEYKIASGDEATSAAEALTKIKGMLQRLEADRKGRLAPLVEQQRAINCEYTQPRDLLEKAEWVIKSALKDFRTAEEEQLEEQRKLELATAEQERERLERQAEKARERGKENQAVALERTAAMVAAPRQTTAPTKLAGVTFPKTWKGKVTDLREFLQSLLKSPYKVEEIVTVNQQRLDRLAGSLQENMDSVLPGAIAWEQENVAARSR